MWTSSGSPPTPASPPRSASRSSRIVRGNAFEAQVKANGGAQLLRLLRELLGLPIHEVAYDDLDDVGGNTSAEVRHAHDQALLAEPPDRPGRGTLFDHPLLRLQVGGRQPTWSRT